MIIRSRTIPITTHTFIGYSALLVMLIDTIMVWRFWLKNRSSQVPNREALTFIPVLLIAGGLLPILPGHYCDDAKILAFHIL
jgi:hypothetical protein